jgi:hypothetical protein
MEDTRGDGHGHTHEQHKGLADVHTQSSKP